jgi:ADP-ribose pyrophosphatase YjhB (NUDIX family)
MKHRIAAGALVVKSDRLLVVHHRVAGRYDFWVPPGGGVDGAEELTAAATRETLEETGLVVEVGSLAYVDEIVSPEFRQCKFWFLANVSGGSLLVPPRATAEHIVEAQFLTQQQLRATTVFPEVLSNDFWGHLREGFAEPRYLGVREMVTG